jgi:hypothetical protein
VTSGPGMTFLAAAGGFSWQGGGFSWWQAIGGFVAVFALLMITLRWLGRWQGGRRHGDAALLAVMPLGPRREVQVLRLRDDVHYIYRQEGSLLLLTTESHAAYRAAHPVRSERSNGGLAPHWLARWLSLGRDLPWRRLPAGAKTGTVDESAAR